MDRRVQIAVFTDEIDRTVALYRDAFNLQMRPLSNPILMFPLGEVELQVCHRDAAWDLLRVLTGDVVTQGVVMRILLETGEQIAQVTQAAQQAGATLVDEAPDSAQLSDFNGVTWMLSTK